MAQEFKARYHIEPVPNASAVVTKNGTFKPYRQRRFKQDLTLLIKSSRPKKPLTGPLAIMLVFALKRPKSVKRKVPTVKPDYDNLTKITQDCGNGLLFEDDSQICEAHVYKIYSDGAPYIDIHLRSMDE